VILLPAPGSVSQPYFPVLWSPSTKALSSHIGISKNTQCSQVPSFGGRRVYQRDQNIDLGLQPSIGPQEIYECKTRPCWLHSPQQTLSQGSVPTARIDQIIDYTASCARLTFLDAYSGYNQIKLKVENEEKTAFITPYGVFCYQVIPFGLKNAVATYQRMMQNASGNRLAATSKYTSMTWSLPHGTK
jgi:hypothetical protein